MRAVGLLCCALLVAGCTTKREETLLTGETMGSTWTVTIAGPTPKPVAELRAGVQQRFDAVVAQMSTYEPESDLSRFNRNTTADWQALQPELFAVMSYALKLASLSEGAYDVTVGPLVNLWGFGPDPERVTPPAAEDIAAAKARVGWQRVELDAAGLRARRPRGTYVDLSSLAKGFGVDEVARYLDAAGVSGFLIDLSGKLRARGVNAHGQPWRVAVEEPRADDPGGAARVSAQVIALTTGAVATAGTYRKHFRFEGQDYSHLIDPRTGWPIQRATASVTVRADDCLAADAWATALLLMPVEDALRLADSRGIAALFIARDDNGSEMRSAAYRRLAETER
jgi:thiamine biosynthesis lipoprotein